VTVGSHGGGGRDWLTGRGSRPIDEHWRLLRATSGTFSHVPLLLQSLYSAAGLTARWVVKWGLSESRKLPVKVGEATRGAHVLSGGDSTEARFGQ
jgi:hypothetical protein